MKSSYSFYIDDRLRIVSWGEETAKLTGRSASRVLGRKYYEVLPRICLSESDGVSMALKNNEKLTCKEYFLNNPGGLIQANITVNPIKDLERKCAKVTLSLNNNFQKRKDSFEFDQTADIGKVATTLAHGIRNSLNAIKGANYYIGEKYANEPTLVKFTKIMGEEVSRLDDFISRFLSTSTPNGDLANVNINAVLERIKVYTDLQLQAHGIKSIFKYGVISRVKADIMQIEQAILNIINNAMEAMGDGGRLSVKTYPTNRKGKDYSVIEISDSGPGIDGSAEDFTPMSESKIRGYGLIITRDIIKNHGGFVEISSKSSTGTKIMLYLPASKAKIDDRKRASR